MAALRPRFKHTNKRTPSPHWRQLSVGHICLSSRLGNRSRSCRTIIPALKFGFQRGDARLDFTDLYAFPKSGDAGKSILVMNVHPSSTVVPLGPTIDEAFASDALYEIKIDTNGDAVSDIAYRINFSRVPDGVQTASLFR